VLNPFVAEVEILVFYAFDLPNRKFGPAKYFFLAWSQQEATPQSPRHLGSFEVDDGQQRRWVLRVDDPKLLTGIDSVFVTAEALGGYPEASRQQDFVRISRRLGKPSVKQVPGVRCQVSGQANAFRTKVLRSKEISRNSIFF
jgi:hypothetical protein